MWPSVTQIFCIRKSVPRGSLCLFPLGGDLPPLLHPSLPRTGAQGAGGSASPLVFRELLGDSGHVASPS